MSRFADTWDWFKGHAEWIYGGICVALGIWSFNNGDPVGGWTCVGIGVALVVVMRWLLAISLKVKKFDKPLTFEEGEIEALRKVGAEPVPIPGEMPPHDPKTCHICTDPRTFW